jgi:ectoine hydroxylase-related dioxygenase (phytanoyl-CoA dioxygenase family)
MTNSIMKTISNYEINEFDKKGFILKKNFFRKSLVKKILKEINSLKSEELNIKTDKYYNDQNSKHKSLLIRIENFYKKTNYLTNLINNKSINKILFKLFRDKPTLFKEKINFKPPGSGPDKLHQDSQAGWNKYTDNFINVLLSVEKSTINNGCLHIDISGNNSSKLLSKKMKPLLKKDLKSPDFKKLLLDEGDLVFFNSYTPHYSLSNNSSKSRVQVYLTFNKEKDGRFRTKYIKDKKKSYPPNNERSPNKRYSYKV